MAERREYKGAAVTTTLAATIQADDMVLSIAPTGNWPTGSVGPFTIVIDSGLSNEEKIKCLSRSGTTITVVPGGRGWDDTAPAVHNTNAEVKHVLGANDVDLVNRHAADTAQDDHTQYVHNTVARNITADHTFSGTPIFTHMGSMPVALDMGVGVAGTDPKPAHGDHKHALDASSILRAIWEVGDFKLTSITGTIDTAEWLECNGAAFNPLTYPELAVLYPSYVVPDFRDRMLSGAGSTRAINAIGGADTITLATTNLPAHKHTVNDPGHVHAITDPKHKHTIDGDPGHRVVVTGGNLNFLSPSGNQNVTFSDIEINSTGITVNSAMTGITTANTGNAVPIDAVPKWRAVRVLIKAG